MKLIFFFFQARDGIRVLVRSRGLGDVYKGQALNSRAHPAQITGKRMATSLVQPFLSVDRPLFYTCLLYTSDAADDLLCVDTGGRPLIKKKN